MMLRAQLWDCTSPEGGCKGSSVPTDRPWQSRRIAKLFGAQGIQYFLLSGPKSYGPLILIWL